MIFVCASLGPSFKKEDLDYCKKPGIYTIAIGENYKIAPWANHLYCADLIWWEINRKKVDAVFLGKKWDSNNFLIESGDSGLGAIKLADYLGAVKIFLLGYDYKAGTDGKLHWFGDHTDGTFNNTECDYSYALKEYFLLQKSLNKKGITVINCNKNSAIPYFKKSSIQAELKI